MKWIAKWRRSETGKKEPTGECYTPPNIVNMSKRADATDELSPKVKKTNIPRVLRSDMNKCEDRDKNEHVQVRKPLSVKQMLEKLMSTEHSGILLKPVLNMSNKPDKNQTFSLSSKLNHLEIGHNTHIKIKYNYF